MYTLKPKKTDIVVKFIVFRVAEVNRGTPDTIQMQELEGGICEK